MSEKVLSEKDEKPKVIDNPEGAKSSEALEGQPMSIKIVFPNSENFILEVSPNEIVQEIHRALMEREESCHRTCFSLRFKDETLDLYTDLRSIEGLKDGSEVRVVEEHYSALEARNHVRHILEILSSLNQLDAYTAKDNMSLSFLSAVIGGDLITPDDFIDFNVPEYIKPNREGVEPPLIPLHPIEADSSLTCLKHLLLSNWNPPSPARRLVGDLLYLVVTFLEGKCCHITASIKGFFVNQSTDEVFNPKPLQNAHVLHSLVDLLKLLSPQFKKNFETIVKKKSKKSVYELLPVPYRVNSWLSPVFPHSADSFRKEDAYAIRLAFEENLPCMTRDWNDELQATRALPDNEFAERVLRDRAIFKCNSDFVASCVRTAVNVVNGEVPAINPSEKRRQQMFIWNNMFLSLGFDVKEHYEEFGGDEAAYRATSCDLRGVKAYSKLPYNGLCILGTALVDYLGFRVTAQTIIPGILEKDQDQLIVYGSNDFGKTVVVDERYSELLADSAAALRIRPHKVIGKDGKTVELMSSVDCKGIIGNDNRTYLLDLLNIFPPDVNYFGGAPKEGRPILSEKMQTLGYPYTHSHLLSSLRPELLDAFCELRTEEFVLHAYGELRKIAAESKSASKSDGEKISEGKEAEVEATKSVAGAIGDEGKDVACASEATTIIPGAQDDSVCFAAKTAQIKQAMAQGTDDPDMKKVLEMTLEHFPAFQDNYKILFNPDAYRTTLTYTEEEKPNVEKDKKLINEICEFLVFEQIPSLIEDFTTFSVIPQDGKALVEILHQRGINVRYLNRIVEELKDKSNIEYLLDLAVCEIAVRAAKHLFKSYMQDVDQIYLSAAVSHFLNCFLTTNTNLQPLKDVEEVAPRVPKTKSGKKRGKAAKQTTPLEMEWKNETTASLWTALNKEVKDYFHIDLESTNIDTFCKKFHLLRVVILRSFCQSVGIQLKLQDYFVKSASRPNPEMFSIDDIIAINPIVKHVYPQSVEARRTFLLGQRQISEGRLEEGSKTITETLNILNAVYGPLHPDIGACNRILARLSYVVNDCDKAVVYQQQATLISERVHGVDHPSTSAEYTHLALYFFACRMFKPAFQLLCRARYLAIICHGPIHPEIAQIDINLALMLHWSRNHSLALDFLQNAHKLNELFYGKQSLKVAFTLHLLCLAYTYLGDYDTACKSEKARYTVYRQRFGEHSEYTRESSNLYLTLARKFYEIKNMVKESQSRTSNGDKGQVAAVLKQYASSPDFYEIIDIMNRVNGIFYLHFEAPKNGMDESNVPDRVVNEPKATTVVVEESPVNGSSPDAAAVTAEAGEQLTQ
ncbi:hypothetical protein Aperf_G00000101429 [Anoplocephala perfoliata]